MNVETAALGCPGERSSPVVSAPVVCPFYSISVVGLRPLDSRGRLSLRSVARLKKSFHNTYGATWVREAGLHTVDAATASKTPGIKRNRDRKEHGT